MLSVRFVVLGVLFTDRGCANSADRVLTTTFLQELANINLEADRGKDFRHVAYSEMVIQGLATTHTANGAHLKLKVARGRVECLSNTGGSSQEC